MTRVRCGIALKSLAIGSAAIALFLVLILSGAFSSAAYSPDSASAQKPTPEPTPKSRYTDQLNGCECNCAGLEAGWECGVMGGPACYYDPPGGTRKDCGGSGICRFEGWGCGRGSPSAACKDKCLEQVVLKPLCAEAIARFNIDEEAAKDPSHLRIDRSGMNADIWGAVELYNTWALTQQERSAYMTQNMGGTVPALTWLFSYEGVADSISKRFVFLQDKDRKKTPNQAPAGTEPALWTAIDKFWKTHGQKPLTPKEVLFLALKERKGNVREALLLTHNTLRSLGRQGSNELTNVPFAPDVFTTHFETLRAPTGEKDPASASDSSGLWYHYFGMAFYQVQSRGDQTAVGLMSLSPLIGPKNAPRVQEAMRLLEQLARKLQGREKDTRSVEAQVLNEMEQLVREYGQREQSQPDPEKYCFNLWAADIGSDLYNGLPVQEVSWGETIDSFYIGTEEAGRDLAATTKKLASEYGSKAAKSAKEAAKTAWDWLTTREAPASPDEMRTRSNRHRIVIEGSAANVTWQDAEGKNLMLFDQETESLYGNYPVPLIPYYEEDNGTWGVAWISPVDEAHKVVLTGTADATVHLTVIDPETGKVAEYAPELAEGDSVTVDFTAGEALPTAANANGEAIEPETFNLSVDKSGTASGSSSGGGSPFGSPIVIGGIVAAIALAAGAFFVMQRRRPSPATVAVRSPQAAAPSTAATNVAVGMSQVSSIAVGEAPRAVGGEICASCGAVFVAGSRFCRGCGATVPTPAPQVEEVAVSEPPTVAVAEPETAQPPVEEPPVPPLEQAASTVVDLPEETPPVTVEEPVAASVENVQPAEAPRSIGGEICASCGAVFVAGSRFCRGCGATVPAPAPQVEEVAVSEPPTVAVAEPETAQPPVEEPPVAEMTAPPTIAPTPAAPPATEGEAPRAVGGETCASCGAVFVAGGRFCRGCGAPAPAQSTPQSLHCTTCGAEVGAGWRFCKSCGGSL